MKKDGTGEPSALGTAFGSLMRGLVYATLFIGFLLIFLPARVLERSGVRPPATIGPAQILGAAMVVAGGALALWCVVTFAIIGRGTPAPFDPPRRLVIRGPYRFVRNPMYLGAGLVLAGATVYYRSLALLGYLAILAGLVHLFVVLYEEPTLRRLFGADYDAYRHDVRRWWPVKWEMRNGK